MKLIPKLTVVGLGDRLCLSASSLECSGGNAKDQLILGMSMGNILSMDPAHSSSREADFHASTCYDTVVEIDATDKSKLLPAARHRMEDQRRSQDDHTEAAQRREISFRQPAHGRGCRLVAAAGRFFSTQALPPTGSPTASTRAM